MHLLRLLDSLSVIGRQSVWDHAIITIPLHFPPHPLSNTHQTTTEARSRSTLEKMKYGDLGIPGQSWSYAIRIGKRTIDPLSLQKEKL
jgi:hypothetical protein